jgi:DNA-binding MarR family transcriptional regulator
MTLDPRPPGPPNITADERVRRVAEFRIALQRFERTSDRVVRRSGMTPRQHVLLLAIEGLHAGSASIGALARELLLAQSTVTELADRAQADGLVERVVARDDARVVFVRTTPEGRRRLERALDALEGERERLASAIDDLSAALRRTRGPR